MYVDGEKAKIEVADFGFMAVNVPAGKEVTIRFNYHTPGTMYGFFVSGICLVMLLIYLAVVKLGQNNAQLAEGTPDGSSDTDNNEDKKETTDGSADTGSPDGEKAALAKKNASLKKTAPIKKASEKKAPVEKKLSAEVRVLDEKQRGP